MERAKAKEPRPEYVAENGATLKREGAKVWSHARQEYLLILLHE